MTVVVRPLEPQDIAPARAILNHLIQLGGLTAYETPFRDQTFARTFLGDDLICCHVAIGDDGNVAGFQWLGSTPSLPGCATIASFARTREGERGIGRALFPVTCKVAAEKGWREIDATIRADNTAGLSYYSRMGFTDHSMERAVPLNDGTPVDRISKRITLIHNGD